MEGEGSSRSGERDRFLHPTVASIDPIGKAMTKNTLVDTDILIHFLRGRREAKNFLSSLLDRSQILCSSITVAEIFAGIRHGEEEKTRALIDNLEVLDVTREIAEKAGHYR